MSNLEFTPVDLECATIAGRYWIARYGSGDWSAKFRPNGSDRYVSIDPPADENGDAQDWPSLDAAKAACDVHHAYMADQRAAFENANTEQLEATRPFTAEV